MLQTLFENYGIAITAGTAVGVYLGVRLVLWHYDLEDKKKQAQNGHTKNKL